MNESATSDDTDRQMPSPATGATNAENTLFRRYAETRDPALRDRLVHEHERLARYLAAKFGGRGEPLEDLVQVARLGLVKCFDRFDSTRGLKFTTYATATIVGELQRYFRDSAWRIKVPRALQELNGTASRAKIALAGRLGRMPTVQEVAVEIGATEEETLRAIEVSSAYSPVSLDTPTTGGESGRDPSELFGEEDARILSMVDNADLDAALTSLDPRQRSVVTCYYFNEMTEMQIATRLCISQMHVSRLKKRALESLKKYMADAA